MSESYKNNRIKFNKVGAQKAFILKAKDLLGLKVFELAQKLNISQRTLADWTREKITISQISAQALSKFSNIPIPKNYSIIDWKTHFQKAGKIGGKNKFKLYGNVGGDEIYRKNKWREWWKTTGQFKKNSLGFQTLIKIKIPKKNLELAEFTGIMLGDGGIAPYYIHITLSNTEKAYIGYVMNLINRLFDVHPKLYKLKYAKAVDIVIQRKKLVDFCQQIGLVLGNKVKHQVDIPEWVKNMVLNFQKLKKRNLLVGQVLPFQWEI
jgi:transcriptional regulator with XRE-family HTH domain